LEATLFESLKNDLRLPERPEEEIFLDLPELEMHLERAAVSGSGTEFFAAEDIATGDRLNQAVVVSIENPRWFLVFFQPQDIFLAPVVAQTNSSLLISLLIGVVVVGLAIVLAQFLTAPINRLTTVANQISGGDLNARAEVEVEDEVGVLAKTFNAMTAQLQALIVNLEDQVAERTKELEKRAGRLKAAAETARDATAETDLRESFNRAVTLTRSRFDLYHVALYLIDDRGEYAVLQAATEAAGERLLASEHRIQVGSNNAVGIACLYGEAHIVGDSPEIGLFEHPLLPLAKSEMALPLKVGEEILGAMDLFSDQENAFTLEDATLLQTMADQIAVATQKTKLRGEVELALEELQAAYGEYTREAWQSLPLKRKRQLGYRYNQLKIEAATDQSPETERVWQQNERVIVEGLTTSLNGEPTSVLAVPVRFRGQAIGVLNLEFDGETVPAEAKELVEEIGERLGLILENVRLLEETQRRVSQERLVNDLSERVRSVLDINTILKTAAQEVQQTIGLPEVTIRLAPPAEFSGNGKQADASENGDVESSETRNE
jgi:GAF domain-containing protein/HAMP domain-containing protein